MIAARSLLPLWLLALAIALAVPAVGYVPDAGPIARAAARSNQAAGRAQALELRVAVRYPGTQTTLAEGTLLASPDGRARLELVRTDGGIERQLRRGRSLRVVRDGRETREARSLVPPVWMLQSRSGSRLLSRLAELGGDPTVVALGYDGAHDCYVLGGRQGAPAVWVDQDLLQVVRVDLGPGETVRFAPVAAPEKGPKALLLPPWFEVSAPRQPPLRLEVVGVRAVDVAADAFSDAWLKAPMPAPPAPSVP